MFGLPLRKGFSMKIKGVFLNRPDLHMIAADLGIRENDILFKDGVLTIYNTSEACQEIIDDNALAAIVAMTADISPEDISDLQEVEEEPFEMEIDLDDDDGSEYC